MEFYRVLPADAIPAGGDGAAARRRGSSRYGPVICASLAWAGSRRWWPRRPAGGHSPRVRSWCSAIR